jgi:hypothetical protein
MLVISKAPIVEEHSNLTAEQRKARRRQRSKKATDTFKGGYSRFKEAGGLPVIENLLGLGAAPPADLAQKTPVLGNDELASKLPIDDGGMKGKKGLSKTQKWMIGIGVAAVLGVAGYYIYKRYAGSMGKSGKPASK